MAIKAIIIDLDNTIYPAAAIANELFAQLYDLLQNNQNHFDGSLANLKEKMARQPFATVAQDHRMSEELYSKIVAKLKTLSYNGEMHFFPDYAHIRTLAQEKHLVTSGFEILQRSKIKQLGIEGDFKSIAIVDTAEGQTKKEVFEEIARTNAYSPQEILVIGDDPDSEIDAALALGMKAVIYDHQKEGSTVKSSTPVIGNFKEIDEFLA